MSEVGIANEEVATSHESSAEAAPDSISMSSADFFSRFAAPEAENLNSDKVDVETESEPELTPSPEAAREETIEQLNDHYGDQLFQYKKYNGTIQTIIDLCPAVQYIVGQGFDAMVAFVDKYKVDEIVKEPEEEKKPETEVVEQKQNDDVKDNSEVKSKEEPVQKVEQEKATKDTPSQSVEASNKSEAIESDIVSKGESRSAKDQSVSTAVLKKDTFQKPEPKVTTIEVIEEVVETPEVVQDIKPVVVVQMPEVIPIAPEVDDSQGSDISKREPEPTRIDAVIEPNVVERTEVPEALKPVELSELSIEPQSEEIIESHQDVRVETIREAIETEDDKQEDLTEILLAETKDERVELNTSFEDDEITELFEDWQELAKQKAPFDVVLAAITDQLEETIGRDDQFTDGNDIADESNEFNMVVADLYKDETLNDESNSELDELLKKEARPELYAMLTAVQSAKKTVEQLYEAKTKEQCQFYIEQLVQDLVIILRGLGYENPEKIIRDFLNTHSAESLYALIKELEASLRHAMWHDVRRQQAYKANHRHARLGKFVSYIMNSVLELRHLTDSIMYTKS